MATYKCKRPYMYGTGRRKQSVARVHLIPNGTGAITINGRDIDDYFGLETLKLIVRQPLAATETAEKFDVEATVVGGGMTGQASIEMKGDTVMLVPENPSYTPIPVPVSAFETGDAAIIGIVVELKRKF